MNDKDLLAKLHEDVGADAEQLLPTAQRLEAFTVPQPTAHETARLLAHLQPHLPRPAPTMTGAWLWLLLRSQLRVVREEIWLGSLLVMALGVIMTFFMQTPSVGTIPFVFLAPLVAAGGVAFIYGPVVDPVLELELAAPVSPRTMLLARLTLLFGFDLVLAIAASLLIAFNTQQYVGDLIWAWLAPMTFLSALAFLLTIVFSEPLIGMMVSLLLWSLQIPLNYGYEAPFAAYIPNLFAADVRVWLFAFALIMGVTALWIAGREERWLKATL